jgi:glycogen debranching enzyme
MRDRFLGLRRYWRGPTWINAAWLLWLGLVRLGYDSFADELTRRITHAIRQSGLREYYDPMTAAGMGAPDFSWSALAADMINRDPRAATSYV